MCCAVFKAFAASAAAANSIYFAFVCFAHAFLCFLFTYLSQYAVNTTSHVVCGIYTRTHAHTIAPAADADAACEYVLHTHSKRYGNGNRCRCRVCVALKIW